MEKYGYLVGGKDFDFEVECLFLQYFVEIEGSDFVFVMKYLCVVWFFYVYFELNEDGSVNGEVMCGFDLLFWGIEIILGGQCIYDYGMLMDFIVVYKFKFELLEGYIEVFKYGMFLYGGFVIGVE